MQVTSIAECSKNSELLSTFIKLQFVIEIFVFLFLSGHLKQDLLFTCRCTQSTQSLENAYNDFGAYRNSEHRRLRLVYVIGILCDSI